MAEIKRLLERFRGDHRFRAALKRSGTEPRALALEYGIGVDPREVWPLLSRFDHELPGIDALSDAPLVALWDASQSEFFQSLDDFLRAGDCPAANSNFAAWRNRQISRLRGETGRSEQIFGHPVIAFELSAGCSVGCWFCGVGAGKFEAHFPYTPDTRRLWRELLEQTIEILGDAVGTGFCFWATEPADNPDYPRFIDDFHTVTGTLPSTTSAMPLRDIDLTRRVMELNRRHGGLPNRFSILTLRMLDRVHAEFSADELLWVELALQNPEAIHAKAFAGRARDHAQRVEKHNRKPVAEGATIACVSGFLVNMIGGSIRLVSPTAASTRWPLGYRVYGERRFKTAQDFRAALDSLIAEHMSPGIAASDRLAFRDDLAFECQDQGFTLSALGSRFAFDGIAGANLFGRMIAQGRSTLGEIQSALVPLGTDPLVVGDAAQRLFDKGLVEISAS